MSGSPVGFVLPALELGLGAIKFKPKRGFFPSQGDFSNANVLRNGIIAQATLDEVHHDELEITEHPIEMGAPIADHAFKRPAQVIIRCAWSNSPSDTSILQQGIGIAAALGGTPVALAASIPATVGGVGSILKGASANQINDVYNKLLILQAQRIPFDIFTGKRHYTNMLFKSLTCTTDKAWENALFIIAVCQQVIIVSTQILALQTASAGNMANPAATAPITSTGNIDYVEPPAPPAEVVPFNPAPVPEGVPLQ